MRLFLIAGHSVSKPGAIAYNGRTEHYYTTRLQGKIKSLIKGVEVITDDEQDNLQKVIDKINDQYIPGDLILDLHFNNNHPTATGTEIIVSPNTSPENKIRASKMVLAISNDIGLRLRKYVQDRCYKFPSETFVGSIAIIERTKAPAILCEVCFLNQHDLAQYEANEDKIAEIIASFYSKEVIGDLDPKSERRV